MSLQEFIYQILPLILSVLSAITSLIITLIKTRQKSITKKVEQSVDIVTHSTRSIDLSDFVVTIEGKEYPLSVLNIRRLNSEKKG